MPVRLDSPLTLHLPTGDADRMTSPEIENTAQLRLLVDRVVADDPDAFDELAARATERLRALSHTMLRKYPQVKRWEDTDDIMQAALMRLHRSLKEVRPATTREFYGLAVTQIRRSLIDLVRHYCGPQGHGANHHSQGGGKAADDSGGYLAKAAADSESPETISDWAAFHETVEKLPAEEQEVFTLIWYGGLLRKDVATLLAIADKTVLRRFNRARIQLQELLGDDAPHIS
ncbi:MAG: sigma-70 family RNA polymerase sigma factor [Pirellulaceae bacterium]